MNKFSNYKDFISDFVMGIVFIVISVLLFVGKDQLYKDIISILVLILLLLSVFQLLKYLFRKLTERERSKTFLACIFNLFVSLLLLFLPKLSYGLLPVIFSLYLFLLGSAQFIMYLLLLGNNENNKFNNFLCGVIYYAISIPILYSPINRIDIFLLCLAIYTLFLGLNFLYDFFGVLISKKTKNKLKRKIRITLPKILESVIPYSVMVEINKSLETYDYSKYSWDKVGDIDMFILIHTSNKGVNKFGHLDIYFDGKIISYGSYDEGSRKFKEIFGDGVIFETSDKTNYINFCIDNSKKTLFEFGIKLNDRQKKKIRKRIDDIFSNTYIWDYKSDKKYNNGSSYAAKLYKKTNATFYKFKTGKYRTYFVLGTNCCYLVDDIVGKSGIDLLSLNGLITPGTYYDYLEKELHRKNSFVISKNVYNASRRAK